MKRKAGQKSSPKVAKIREQIAAGHSERLGFLHIPKTGGSGVKAYGKALIGRGHRFPCMFGHRWPVGEILAEFPEMELCFILRDPLARVISGYNSRIRQGRPTYDSVWSPGEAAAFAILPSVRHLLDAMLADDEFSISAVAYAMRHVRHLHWNYSFYFKNKEFIDSHGSRFRLIGEITAFDDFVGRLTELVGAPRQLAAELYEKIHEAGPRGEDPLAGYSADEIGRIKAGLRREYRLHAMLAGLAGKGPA